MAPPFIWQALDGQGWPFTAAQEAVFVEDLRRASAGAVTPTRPSVTCLINALRCGVTLAELLEVLPGVNPAALLSAHVRLEATLHETLTSWQRIVDRPTVGSLSRHSPRASLLFPAVTQGIAALASRVPDEAAVVSAVVNAAERMQRTRARADGLEALLTSLPSRDPRGVAAGRGLHDIASPSLWADDHFSPRRVGELSPIRIADLWGDGR